MAMRGYCFVALLLLGSHAEGTLYCVPPPGAGWFMAAGSDEFGLFRTDHVSFAGAAVDWQ
jgi:hypothetical protein